MCHVAPWEIETPSQKVEDNNEHEESVKTSKDMNIGVELERLRSISYAEERH